MHNVPAAGSQLKGFPAFRPASQVGVALLTGKTGAPAAAGPERMDYEKEVVTTEGGLEALVEVSW